MTIVFRWQNPFDNIFSLKDNEATIVRLTKLKVAANVGTVLHLSLSLCCGIGLPGLCYPHVVDNTLVSGKQEEW